MTQTKEILEQISEIAANMCFCKSELNVDIKGCHCSVSYPKKICVNEDLRNKILELCNNFDK